MNTSDYSVESMDKLWNIIDSYWSDEELDDIMLEEDIFDENDFINPF